MNGRKPGSVAQEKVFKAEMTRRMVQDCLDVVEHMGTKRPDVRIRVRPVEYDDIVWAEVRTTAREDNPRAEGIAYITPGTPRAEIYIEMQKAVDMLDANLKGESLAA